MNEGQIVDTVVQGMFTPIAGLPATFSAVGMMVTQAAIHIPVPSTSSQAVLTLPLLVPLSDLIGLSRQVTVLAYQYGAGLCEIVKSAGGNTPRQRHWATVTGDTSRSAATSFCSSARASASPRRYCE